MKTITCIECGNMFEAKTAKAKYCSNRCKCAHYSSRHATARACVTCGTEFKSVHAGTKYCSVNCQLEYQGIPMKELVCCACGITFTFKGRTSARRCPDCRKAHASIRQMRYRASKDDSVHVGVGSGGRQLGVDNHRWNTHSRYHGYLRRQGYTPGYTHICYKYWDKVCAICGTPVGEDIIDVHHINGVRDDSRLSNLIPLCRRRCHPGVHRGFKGRSPEEYTAHFFKTYPHIKQDIECRIKIAELSGDLSSETTRTEGSSETSQGQSIGAEKI